MRYQERQTGAFHDPSRRRPHPCPAAGSGPGCLWKWKRGRRAGGAEPCTRATPHPDDSRYLTYTIPPACLATPGVIDYGILTLRTEELRAQRRL